MWTFLKWTSVALIQAYALCAPGLGYSDPVTGSDRTNWLMQHDNRLI